MEGEGVDLQDTVCRPGLMEQFLEPQKSSSVRTVR